MEHKLYDTMFKKEQYNNQSNIVYFNTMIMCSIISIIFLFIIESKLAAVVNLIAIIFSAMAIWMNKKEKYDIGAFVFIAYISIITVVQILIFGWDAGYQYYFFNMAILIVFTSWKSWQKFISLLIESIVFIFIFMYMNNHQVLVSISYKKLFFLHTINVLLNIVGVANSAHYYISIATKWHKKVLNLALKDYLTNLMNRSSFDDFFADIFQKRIKTKMSVGIMILDIDYFKKINDNYGHICGDEILKQFAQILTKTAGTNEYVARYGGEEFVIIAKTEKSQFEALAECIRAEVQKKDFLSNNEVIKITVSIGALFIEPNTNIEQQQALDKVDKLLYKAKDNGRNRVVLEYVS